MAAMVAEHLTNRADHGNRLWLLLNAEIWYRMQIQGQSAQQLEADLKQPAQRRVA
jgi:hypothetical protein